MSDDGVMVDGKLYCCVHHAQADRWWNERKARRTRDLTLPKQRNDETRKWPEKENGCF